MSIFLLFPNKQINWIFCFVFCVAVMFLQTQKTYAQSPPVVASQIPDTCDPDYMDVLNARTYLEAKREMETAQRIILKPDSVLEYSCFNEEEIWLGTYGGRFSEFGLNAGGGNPAEFDGVPVATRVLPNSLENALSNVVEASLVRFLDSFSHIYGGGTFPIIPNPFAGCNSMNIVWFTSKCQNFDRNWWVRFEDLSAIDIRVFPIPCLPVYDIDRTTNLNGAIAASYPAPEFPPPYNDPTSITPVTAVTPAPTPNGRMDALDAFSANLIGACTAPMPTGVVITLDNGATFIDEAVCVQPKCYFDGTTCTR